MTERNRRAVALLDEVLERRMMLYVLAAGSDPHGCLNRTSQVIFTPSSAYVSEDFSIDLDNDVILMSSCHPAHITIPLDFTAALPLGLQRPQF